MALPFPAPGPNSPQAQVHDQGAIYAEKEQQAQKDLERILGSYRKQYDDLVDKSRVQNQYADFAKNVNSDGGLSLLWKDYDALKSNTSVTNRLNEVTSNVFDIPSWFGLFLNIIIGLLVIVVIYMAYRKYASRTSSESIIPSVVSGGNRLTTK